MALIVQKFGGTSVADPQKILAGRSPGHPHGSRPVMTW